LRPIRIVLAEDHPLILSSLSGLLQAEPDIEVATTCADGAEAARAVEALRPDVAVFDIRMPGLSGLDAAERLAASAPEVPVLLLTTFEEPAAIRAALRLGVRGFVLKDVEPAVFVLAIRSAAAGLFVYHACVAPFIADAERLRPASAHDSRDEPYGLTETDLRVVAYIAEGMSNKEIAEADRCSEGTVKNRVSSILSKMGLQARTQIAVTAIKKGLV